MSANIIYQHWGLIPYEQAFEKQTALFNKKIAAKLEGKTTDNYLILCHHPHVYTLGRNGKTNNLLVNKEFLDKISATFHQTNRGGDITYHGYGQIVGYPILDLDQFHLGLKSYINLMEQSIIALLANYNIKGERLEGATGVWLSPCGERPRKICAIGVKASRSITMHGFALNVNTDLSYFNYINPCGFTDKAVTSLQQELGKSIDEHEVSEHLKQIFLSAFQIKN